MTRILIADEQGVVRSDLRSIIEDRIGWAIVAEASDGRDTINKAVATKPDVAVLAYDLPVLNGYEVTRQIRQRVASASVLIFSKHDDDMVLRDVLQAGALGYLLKSDGRQHLISAIGCLANHEPFFAGKAARVLLASFLANGRQNGEQLSNRERTIVQMVAEGLTNKQIVEMLHIGVKTVEAHRASANRKLGQHSTAGLVRYAIRNHMIEP